MRRFVPVNLDLALLLLRLVLAAILLYHGIPKLLHFSETAGAFQGMNIPAPTVTAGFALVVEVVGGLLLLLGVATDIVGLLVVIEMIGAIAFVHWSKGFDFAKVGWEHPFTVLVIAVAIALSGPGAIAVRTR
jgi:putative oxidoreductase